MDSLSAVVKPSSPKNTMVDEARNVEENADPNVEEYGETDNVENSALIANADEKSELEIKEIVDMLKELKLNPLAEEFFPSYFYQGTMEVISYVPSDNDVGYHRHANSRRRRNYHNHSRRRMSSRAFRAQRADSIRRTVYVSDIDHSITEERLAALFGGYGQVEHIKRPTKVVDCRVCGDPHSRLRFAFVEFLNEYSASSALNLNGTLLGFSRVKVLPSKTAILPVNPTFLPRSDDERDMCLRTVYCTNIDKKVSQVDLKNFFEARCGEVSRMRLLGDHTHSTRIAFVEFFMAESAILALNCCGQILGTKRIRVSPSKTPVRPQFASPETQ